MFMTIEEANRGFVQMVEHATADFDLERAQDFYYYICGASDLLKKIRESAEKTDAQMKAAAKIGSDVILTGKDGEPHGRYL